MEEKNHTLKTNPNLLISLHERQTAEVEFLPFLEKNKRHA